MAPKKLIFYGEKEGCKDYLFFRKGLGQLGGHRRGKGEGSVEIPSAKVKETERRVCVRAALERVERNFKARGKRVERREEADRVSEDTGLPSSERRHGTPGKLGMAKKSHCESPQTKKGAEFLSKGKRSEKEVQSGCYLAAGRTLAFGDPEFGEEAGDSVQRSFGKKIKSQRNEHRTKGNVQTPGKNSTTTR